MSNILGVRSFFKKIERENLVDIFLCGVVDFENSLAEFTPILTYIFFVFETEIIKFESIEQHSKLKIKYVDAVTCEFDFELEEDMYPARTSISEIVLTDTLAENTVNYIQIYGESIINNELICYAISFKLNCGQEIFLDPSYIFGINIGGQEQKNAWFNNYPNSEERKIPMTEIKL